MIKKITLALALPFFALVACGGEYRDLSPKEISALSAKQKKVRDLQLALRHFKYYEGDITAQLDRKTYAAMTLYSIDAREKRGDNSTGEITDAEIDQIIAKYKIEMKQLQEARKRAAEISSSKRSGSSGSSSSSSGGSSSSSSSGGGRSGGI